MKRVIMDKCKFKMGQRVYHVVGETDMGIVIDICYKFRSKQYEYCVAFSHTATSLWYYEDELTEQPIFK